jgi:phosphoserine phosphatase RsbU/P
MSEAISIPKEVVEKEFYRSTEKFHVIAAWVGVVLNLVWFVGDYFVLPDHWIPFLVFRAVVSGIAMLLLLSKKITGLNIYSIVFVLVLGIAVQNAYMWSVMDLAHLQKHTFAYMALFIGVGMLVLWDVWYSIIIVVATIISNIVFYKINSPLTMDEFLINGGLLILTVAIFCIFLIRTRYNLTISEIRSRLELERSKHIIEEDRNVISKKNREITDSLNYASRIQKAVIPAEAEFSKAFPESFVLFKPRDIVSGDFYWITSIGEKVFYATADCTGHGVPGGFVTMLGLSFLEEIFLISNIRNPGEALNVLREKIINSSKTSQENSQDGMDITLCCIDKKTNILTYAAANNSFFVLRNNELLELKADKQPCGLFFKSKPFTQHEFQLNKGDCIYTFTDGYADQFGGPNGKKFMYKQFEDLLLKNGTKDLKTQGQILESEIDKWKGDLEQVDDILVIGIRIT